MINFKRLLKSFKYAFKGLGSLIRKEQNFRVHVIAGIIAIFFSVYFSITAYEWIIIIFLITMVMMLEMLNTVFERMADVLKPRVHDYIKEIKDIMSAMVFLATLVSLIVGAIIFWPYIFS